jgi:flagellar protein FliJ
MARPFRLQTLLDLGVHRLDAAALELQKLHNALRQSESKLEQLRGIQREYDAALFALMTRGVEADRLRDFQRFLARLKMEMQVQGAETQRCQEAWTQQHERWRDLRRRERALDALRARHARGERLRDQGREQREQDEFALRTRKENLLDTG